MIDIPFDQAQDVMSITYRLHPLDVGFDPRKHGMAVKVRRADRIRISYQDGQGARRVIEGPQAKVLRRLRALGYTFQIV